MLMELLRQKSEYGDDQSSVLPGELASSKSQSSMPSIVTNRKSTMDLIQAIYKQMGKINNQLSEKSWDINDFAEMERKMKKLQRKFTKISQSNHNESV